MKRFILFLFLLALASVARPQSAKFDQHLADSLGADAYGMKNYVLVILKTGKVKADKFRADSLFTGHMQNIGRLAKAGQLVAAGPMAKNDHSYEGIFILNVTTLSAARELLETDPAVKAGLLDPELYQWYGSAALPLYLPFHDKVKKTDF